MTMAIGEYPVAEAELGVKFNGNLDAIAQVRDTIAIPQSFF
jgi:hypothetical protein